MLVQVKDLHKEYAHGGRAIHVLRGIDMDVDEGEMLSIEGASGVGKSTLLHVLGALDRATSGSISFDGRELTRMSQSELAHFRGRHIGFVFQAHHLLPEFTALENVMLPALIQRVSMAEARRRAEELLTLVGLEERMTHRPGQLSGGEQQRVALCRALVMKPRLLLADEPTGNLDSKTGDGIHDLFFDMNASTGITILIATHNRELASRMPRQLHMVDGRIEVRQPILDHGVEQVGGLS
ncbi:MAG: ABC transporter ATP-binding protein [Deltaproteobacteria bacterium]|nr:ABC transporter ATP-binding protein [Deltaproteobacteria bacterium]